MKCCDDDGDPVNRTVGDPVKCCVAHDHMNCCDVDGDTVNRCVNHPVNCCVVDGEVMDFREGVGDLMKCCDRAGA